MLSLVVGGDERAHEILSSALHASGQRDLPRSAADLSKFARAHLTYGLIDELGPRLAATVLDELTRELMRGVANVSPTAEDDAPSSSVRSVEPKDSVASPLARITTQARKVTEENVSGVRVAKTDRPKIAIVEQNAFVRSSLSRALVRAGYDVAAIDDLEGLQAADGYAAVLVSMRGTDVETSLAAVLALEPTVSLIAYFVDETNVAALRRSGAKSAVVVSALSPLDQVVASVASVIEAPAPSSRR